jgi:hypothetical protein
MVGTTELPAASRRTTKTQLITEATKAITDALGDRLDLQHEVGGSTRDRTARFKVPSETSFYSQEFLPAPAIAEIGDALIAKWPELGGLEDLTIKYEWKKKGGTKGGKATLGKCSKVSGLTAYYSDADFVIWIAADNCRETKITVGQMEALVFHELKHIEVTEDEETGELGYAVRPHDVEMFYDEVIRYGLWKHDLKGADEVFAQARLDLNGEGE